MDSLYGTLEIELARVAAQRDALAAALRGALGVLNAMASPDMNLITLRDNCRAALAMVRS